MSADTAPPRAPLGSNYRKLFAASVLSNLGDGLMLVAVVWLASALTRDAVTIAVVGLLSRLPWLVFSLPAGVIADRFDRRRLVAVMDVTRLGIVAAFAALVAVGGGDLPTPQAVAGGASPPDHAPVLLAALCVVSLLLGFAEVVRDNAAQTLMPSIVQPERLETANGRLWGAETAMNNFVGPPLAGLLIGVAVALPFVVNAGLLAVSAALIFGLAGTFSSEHAGGRHQIEWRAEIADGFRWLWNHQLLRSLALLLGVMNLLSSVAFVVVVLYAQEILGLFEGWQFGLVLTGTATGSVVGAFVADRISARLGTSNALLVSIVGMGISTAAIGMVSDAALFWLAGAAGGVMIVLWNVITVSLRQRIIPNQLLGRVNSVYRFFGWGTISLGTLLGGVLVSIGEPIVGREWALRTPFLLAGAAHVGVFAYARRRISRTAIADATTAASANVTPL